MLPSEQLVAYFCVFLSLFVLEYILITCGFACYLLLPC